VPVFSSAANQRPTEHRRGAMYIRGKETSLSFRGGHAN
jgi:hypothetical protein